MASRLSRRRFVVLGSASTIAAGSVLLAACGGSSSNAPATSAATTGTGSSTTTSTTSSGTSATPATSGGTAASPAAQATRTVTKPPSGGELKIALSNEPPNLDPHQASALLTAEIISSVFDTLLFREEDNTLVPGLATKWDVSSDGTTVTFTLQSGVKFHDGAAFNAAAMKQSLDRMIDPATKSGLAASLLGPYKSSEAVDDATLKVTLGTAYAPLMGNLASVFTAPVSPAAIKQYGLDVATHPVGTGPFMFKEWVQKDHMTYDRFPDYNWAPAFFGFNGPAPLDRLTFQFVAEDATRIATLQNGQADMVESFPPQFVSQFQDKTKYAIDVKMNPGVPFSFMVNTQKAPTNDLAVRQAIEYGIDKDSISKTLLFGINPPARGPLAPVSFAYWKGAEQLYGFDAAKASSVLEQAGWAAGSGGIRAKGGQSLSVEFWTLSDIVSFQNIAQAFQAQMKTVGIDVKIVSLARAAWGAGVESGKHNLTVQIFGLADPSVLSINFHSKNIPQNGGQGFNWSFYKNPQLDSLLDQGDVTLDSTKRIQIYQDAQQIIMNDAIIVPVYVLEQVWARTVAVQGLTYGIGGLPFFYTASLKK